MQKFIKIYDNTYTLRQKLNKIIIIHLLNKSAYIVRSLLLARPLVPLKC